MLSFSCTQSQIIGIYTCHLTVCLTWWWAFVSSMHTYTYYMMQSHTPVLKVSMTTFKLILAHTHTHTGTYSVQISAVTTFMQDKRAMDLPTDLSCRWPSRYISLWWLNSCGLGYTEKVALQSQSRVTYTEWWELWNDAIQSSSIFTASHTLLWGTMAAIIQLSPIFSSTKGAMKTRMPMMCLPEKLSVYTSTYNKLS